MIAGLLWGTNLFIYFFPDHILLDMRRDVQLWSFVERQENKMLTDSTRSFRFFCAYQLITMMDKPTSQQNGELMSTQTKESIGVCEI